MYLGNYRCRMNQRPLWIVGSIIVVTMVVTIYNTNVTPLDTRPCEESSTGKERERVIKSISTQGTVCSNLRRIGGLTKKPSRAAGSFGPDGMWYVCFDEQVQLNPGSCVVYSFGLVIFGRFELSRASFFKARLSEKRAIDMKITLNFHAFTKKVCI